MNDILKKFDAVPYIPGKKINAMISTDKLLILDKAMREGRIEKREGA